MVHISTALLAASTALLASAHPGQSLESKKAELHERATYIASLENTDLLHCVGSMKKRGDVQRTVERRANYLKSLRQKRGLDVDG